MTTKRKRSEVADHLDLVLEQRDKLAAAIRVHVAEVGCVREDPKGDSCLSDEDSVAKPCVICRLSLSLFEQEGAEERRLLPNGWDDEKGEPCACGAMRGRWGADGATWVQKDKMIEHRPARAGGCSL